MSSCILYPEHHPDELVSETDGEVPSNNLCIFFTQPALLCTYQFIVRLHFLRPEYALGVSAMHNIPTSCDWAAD